MTTVWRFLAKFASLIVGTLHCFDRVIFKGHLALSAPKELERCVDYVLKVRRSHFMNVIAPGYANQLIEHAQSVAARAAHVSLSLRVLQEGYSTALSWPSLTVMAAG
jgi:hypothetical protein